MRSSVDNPLWEDAAGGPACSSSGGSRAPLSPLETALQALAINAPRSSSHGGLSSFCTAAGKSVQRRSVPLNFEEWRPSSSEVRQALTTQSAAAVSSGGGGNAAACGSAGHGRTSRSASLSPVCWSLVGSQGAENILDWQHSDLQHSHLQHSEAPHATLRPLNSPEMLLAPLRTQPTESPLKRLRLSSSPPDVSPSAAFSISSPAADAASGGTCCASSPTTAAGSIVLASSPSSMAEDSAAASVSAVANASGHAAVAFAELQPAAGACSPSDEETCWDDASSSRDPASPSSVAAGSHGEASSAAGSLAEKADDSCCGSPPAVRVQNSTSGGLAVCSQTQFRLPIQHSLRQGPGSVTRILPARVQECSLQKQEAALQARRRADLADLRSIMAAGAAAHGCMSPAPAWLQVDENSLVWTFFGQKMSHGPSWLRARSVRPAPILLQVLES